MGSTFLTVGRMMITVIRAVGAAAMANPILIVIAAVIAGLYLLWSNWDTVSQYIEQAIQAVSDAVDAGMQWIVLAWDGAMNGISETASSIWESIKDTFRSGVNWVIDQVNGLIASVNGLSIDIPSLTGGAPTHVDSILNHQHLSGASRTLAAALPSSTKTTGRAGPSAKR